MPDNIEALGKRRANSFRHAILLLSTETLVGLKSCILQETGSNGIKIETIIYLVFIVCLIRIQGKLFAYYVDFGRSE